MEGRGVSPPPLPVEVLPRATLRPELVAAHDLGTDVPREVASEVVVQPSGSAGIGSVRPARGGEGPRDQVGREAGDATTSAVGMSEGRLEALAFASAEPVHRHAEVLHSQQLRHSSILSRSVRTPFWDGLHGPSGTDDPVETCRVAGVRVTAIVKLQAAPRWRASLCIVCRPSSTAPKPIFASRCLTVG